MPRKTTEETSKEIQKNHKEAVLTVPSTSVEEKLDLIVMYMHRMDKRDRLRTIGGFIRGIMALVPLALLLWSTWYFFAHSDEFMEKITKQAVKQTAEYSQKGLMDKLEEYMNK